MFKGLKEAKEQRQENKRILEALNETNFKYFAEFSWVFVREAMALSKNDDNRDTEILFDIYQAQMAGQSAEDFFGMDAKRLGEEMARELPNKSPIKDALLNGAGILIIPLIFIIIVAVKSSGEKGINAEQYKNIGWFILSLFIFAFVSLLLDVLIGRILIDTKRRTRLIISYIIRFIIILFMILTAIFLFLK